MASVLSKDSRFFNTPLVVDGGIERYIEWQSPFYGVVQNEKLYVVTQSDIYRPDLISYRCYGVSDLWWLILNFNNISDPFSLDVGDKLIIPDIDTVNQVLAQQLTQSARTLVTPAAAPVSVIVPYQPPVYVAPTLPTDAGTQSTDPQASTNDTIFVYGFRMPDGLTGNVHFQLVASAGPDFSTLALNKFTLSDQTRWFFYNPSANSGAGGYQAFPSGGIDGTLYDGQTIYYNVSATDGLSSGIEYFMRYRTWISNVDGPWQVSPPIIIP